VPALIADAGDVVAWRYMHSFTSNIRNPNTRRAYARTCASFFGWCDEPGLALGTIAPRCMLFDWLVIGQQGSNQ
jgi:hypothetical protein